MEDHKIQRINELSRLSKTRALTDDEAAEQKSLRVEYLEHWRRATAATLDNTYVLDENGKERPLGKKGN
jgi:Uncharacterized protein conserved in bacteria